MSGGCPFATRRGFLTAAGGLVAGAGASALVGGGAKAGAAKAGAAKAGMAEAREAGSPALPFYGSHQGGIATPQQSYTYFAVLDVTTAKRAEVVQLLKRWSEAAARLAAGETAAPLGSDPTKPGADSGDALGLGARHLTLTFGFGPGLFLNEGKDRFGLSRLKPPALADLPRFNGDQILKDHTGGDLSLQACADDPQSAFHAVRQLVRLAYGTAAIRWTQAGFIAPPPSGEVPRNLMGFKDGIVNPSPDASPAPGPKGAPLAGFDEVVWVGSEGPKWLQGGSYLVARRIRMALEHWDRMEVDFQEQVFGRYKYSGVPLGGKHMRDALDLDAVDKDGNPVIPDTAHIRLAAPATNGGAQMLRRSYSYNDGVNFIAERWPPWHQGMEYDAGLLFLCYQRDPARAFIPIYEKMSKLDMLNQFVTHNGSGLFACPPGAEKGGYVGQALFEA